MKNYTKILSIFFSFLLIVFSSVSCDLLFNGNEDDDQEEVGIEVGGALWYLADDGASCDDTCASHGGYNEATRTYAGVIDEADVTVGVNINNCDAVLNALAGTDGAGSIEFDGPDIGAGCFLFYFQEKWTRSLDPVITLSNSFYDGTELSIIFQRACACNE